MGSADFSVPKKEGGSYFTGLLPVFLLLSSKDHYVGK